MFFYSAQFGSSADYDEMYFYHNQQFSRNEFVELYNEIINKMNETTRYDNEYKNFIELMKTKGFVYIEPELTIYNELEIMTPVSTNKNHDTNSFIHTDK